MTYIYMNHRIREANPKGPVIVAQGPDGTQESNEFILRLADGQVIGRVVFDRAGLAACETHDVNAWVELEPQVLVLPTRFMPPVASAKKPGKPVQLKLIKKRK